MSWIRVFLLRSRALLWRRRAEEGLNEELQSHLGMLLDDHLKRGLSREEARYAAARAFGGVEQVKEEYREQRGLPMLEVLAHDLRNAFRRFRSRPGFVAIAVVTLAIGIGANTAIFSLLNTLLLRDLPVRQPGQLVEIGTHGDLGPAEPVSFPIFDEIARRQHAFSQLTAWLGDGIASVEVNGTLTRADFYTVDGNFYDELGVVPLIGRLLTPADVKLHGGAPASVAVLGYGFWRRVFGGSAAAIGKTIRLEGISFTVVGVTRPGFTGMGLATEPDVTIPLTAAASIMGADPDKLYSGSHFWLRLTGRLKPGVTLAHARAQVSAIWPAVLKATLPSDSSARQQSDYLTTRVEVMSAATGIDWFLRSHFATPLYVLMGLAGLVLLIACVNLANLMLAEGAARSHEMAVRVALGAGRSRLARQVLTESVLLSGAGAVAGIASAYWSSAAMGRFMMSSYAVPPALRLGPDARVLAFTLGTALLTGVFFGLASALHAARQDPAGALQEGARTIGGGAGRFGRLLMCAEVALSVVLLTCAGLFVRSLENLRAFNPGFRSDGVLDVQLFAVPGGYKDIDNVSYYSQLVRSTAAIPGVRSASLAHFVPGWSYVPSDTVSRAGASPAGPGAREADFAAASPGFFETIGISLLRGRGFSWQDTEKTQRVAVLSEKLATELFPSGDAVGRRVGIGSDPKRQDLEVIGVVSNARIHNVRSPQLAAVYVDALQEGQLAHWGNLLIRTTGDPTAIVPEVGRLVNSMGHEYVFGAKTLKQADDQALLNERMTAALSEVFGGLALLVAAVGLYGLMAFAVTRRTHEIGIRMALGAPRRDVRSMVLGQTIRLVAIGIAIGVPCALAANRAVAHLLFGLSPDDPLTMAVVSLSLLLTGLAAGYIPAMRATKVDPMVALRHE
jgi:predicted permease